MKRAVLEDIFTLFWLLLLFAWGTFSLLLLSLFIEEPYILLSIGLALSLLFCKLGLVCLWALSERMRINPESMGQDWLSTFFLVAMNRFRAFAADLYVFPWVRSLHQVISGRSGVDPSALLVGPFVIDALSFVKIGAGSVVDVHSRLCPFAADVEGPPAEIVIGRDTVLQAADSVYAGAVLGDGVFIGARSVIGRDCVIEDGATVPPASVIPPSSVVKEGATWAG